ATGIRGTDHHGVGAFAPGLAHVHFEQAEGWLAVGASVLADAPIRTPVRESPGRLDGQIVGRAAQVEQVRWTPTGRQGCIGSVGHELITPLDGSSFTHEDTPGA